MDFTRDEVYAIVEDTWHGRRSIDPITDQTNIIWESLKPKVDQINQFLKEKDEIEHDLSRLCEQVVDLCEDRARLKRIIEEYRVVLGHKLEEDHA